MVKKYRIKVTNIEIEEVLMDCEYENAEIATYIYSFLDKWVNDKMKIEFTVPDTTNKKRKIIKK